MTVRHLVTDAVSITHGFLFLKWQRLYRGSCTFWYDARTGRRADSATEERLFEIWRQRHRRDTPAQEEAPQGAVRAPILKAGGSMTDASAAAS